MNTSNFRNELIEGEQANLKDFEKESANFFEGCLPIEEIARRGIDTMRYGPLKSIGLWNPKWGNLFDRENRLKKKTSCNRSIKERRFRREIT